jgi:hypothetical protein
LAISDNRNARWSLRRGIVHVRRPRKLVRYCYGGRADVPSRTVTLKRLLLAAILPAIPISMTCYIAKAAGTSAPHGSLTAPASEYVRVPGGRRQVHQSCVHIVPEAPGTTIDLTNDDIRQNGQLIAHYPPCQYRDLQDVEPQDSGTLGAGAHDPTPSGNEVSGAQQTFNSGGNGWNYIYAAIEFMPPLPPCFKSCNGTVQFFWIGLSPSSAVALDFMQPVLQFGETHDGYNHQIGSSYQWWAANWACYSGSGHCYAYSPILVQENDYVSFSLAYISGSPSNASWEVCVSDSQQNETGCATFVGMNGPMQLLDLGVYEEYGVTACNQQVALPGFGWV